MKTKNRLVKLAISIIVILLLIGGTVNARTNFIIGGYFTSWSGSVNNLPFDKMTHINYAFAVPNDIGDGSLQPIPEPQRLSDLISAAHIHGTKVLISVGGWNGRCDNGSNVEGCNDGFKKLSSNPTSINNFANNIVNIVDQYNLDGVDIDWEFPQSGTEQVQNYANMMKVLGEAMHSRGKLLTAAVASEGDNANGISSDVFNYVDWLIIMSYDNADGDGHATYDYAVSNLNYWQNRRLPGLPVSKTVLGVPFYARPGLWPYRDAVAVDRANAYKDCATVNGIYGCYNGIPTIKKKVKLLKDRGAGIMAWELSMDTTDETSLINAMYTTSENIALNKPVTASSIETPDFPPDKAVDDSAGTRWSSTYSDTEWIQVDLGNTYAISRVVLNWEAAFGRGYKIQISKDGTNWEDIYTTSNGDGGIDDLKVSGNGRYIRMYGTQRETQWGYSLWEFEVYGDSASQQQNPTLSSSYISPSSINPGQSFTGYYVINNPNSNNMNVGLGLSIRLSGTYDEIVDIPNDEIISVAPGTNTYSRTFNVPSSASTGGYDVVQAIWSDSPGTGTQYGTSDWKYGVLTVSSQQQNPTLSSSYISPSSINPGQSFTGYYVINNPNSNNMNVGLGLSIRLSGTYDEIVDIPNDEIISVAPGTNTYSRTFNVPSSASTGGYDVVQAIWSDSPGTGTQYGTSDWKYGVLTVS